MKTIVLLCMTLAASLMSAAAPMSPLRLNPMSTNDHIKQSAKPHAKSPSKSQTRTSPRLKTDSPALEYDGAWQPTSVTKYSFWNGEWEKDWGESFSFYDGNGLLKSRSNSYHNETVYVYDDLGRLIESTDYCYGDPSSKTVLEYHDLIPEALASRTIFDYENGGWRQISNVTFGLEFDEQGNVTAGKTTYSRTYPYEDFVGYFPEGEEGSWTEETVLGHFTVTYGGDGTATSICIFDYDYEDEPNYVTTYSDIIWNNTDGHFYGFFDEWVESCWESYDLLNDAISLDPLFVNGANRIKSAVVLNEYDSESEFWILAADYPDDKGSYEFDFSGENGTSYVSHTVTDNNGSYRTNSKLLINIPYYDEETDTWVRYQEVDFCNTATYDEYGIMTYFEGLHGFFEPATFTADVIYDGEFGYPLEVTQTMDTVDIWEGIEDVRIQQRFVFSDYVNTTSSGVESPIADRNCGNMGKPMYYTPSGIPVDYETLAPGLYIRRDCKGSAKVVVK